MNNSAIKGLRGYQKKRTFNQVKDAINETGYRDKRLLFNAIRDKHYNGDIPEFLKEPFLYVISKQLKEIK